jgi:pimeloyl-ACP methyl ester carboxylesterase
MRTNHLTFGTIAAMAASVLCGQDISGDWQGTLKVGAQDLRTILKIARADDGGWKATMISIDQSPDRGAGMGFNSITLEGSDLKFSLDAVGGHYEGKVSADGNSIAGTWNQGQPKPLEFQRATPETAWKDPSPHTVQFVAVDKDVKLEVLDWGGTGRPMVLITGLGNSGHIFDKFALKLTPQYHVYGITRRGFGASSSPATGYSADRLGDDVLAVLDFLKLDKPVLVGHSIGGEELSSIGSRHPERVAGLIYLDAGYSYAFYDKSRGDFSIDLMELEKKLDQLWPGKGPRDPRPVVKELLESALPAFEKDLKERQKDLESMPASQFTGPQPPAPAISMAIIAGEQKYTSIPVPILAIYAVPHDRGASGDAAAKAAQDARDEATTGAQAKAFEAGIPTARVVRLPHANHYVFFSNEADVLKEMNAFVGTLAPVAAVGAR